MNVIDTRDRVKCRLTADITATQTLLPVGPGSQDFLPDTGHATLAVLRDAEHSEVVLVTGVDFGLLTVERGQDGSTPRAFRLGALVSMRLVEGSFEQHPQKGVMRQVAYNPNMVLMPAYLGEKVAETGVDGCVHRVWQNVMAEAAQWRIVYGDMCKDLTNWRDWNWPKINIGWKEWPVVTVRECIWTEELSSVVFDEGNDLYILYRACYSSGVSASVTTILDDSGSGIDAICDLSQEDIPAKIVLGSEYYYSFGTKDLGIAYWGRTDFHSSAAGKLLDNTYVFTGKIDLIQAGDFEGEVRISIGNGYLWLRTTGEGTLFDNMVPSSGDFDFTHPSLDDFSVVALRIKEDGAATIRINGQEIFSGAFVSPVNTDVSPGGWLWVLNSGGTMNFDFYEYMWFKKALSDEALQTLESELMTLHEVAG